MVLSKSQKKLLTSIIIGGLLFFLTVVYEKFFYINPVLYIILMTAAYIILGYDIMLTAAKNIKKGKVFDENFLMCIATIGAYILRDYSECVVVMLLFDIGEFFQNYAVAKSRKSIKDLMDICPEYANIEREGKIEIVTPFEVEVGDIILVKPGDQVKKGQEVIVYEAMKMQNNIESEIEGIVKKVLVSEGDVIAANQPLIEFKK